MTTALAPDPTFAARARWQLRDSLVLARRNLAHVRQIPEKLIDVTFQRSCSYSCSRTCSAA